MKTKNKDLILFLILNFFLITYLLIIGINFKINNLYMEIYTTKLDVWIVLLIMFFLELLSTLTFSTRIYFTSKEKFNETAIFGTISWLVAGMQGILFISGNINFNIENGFLFTFLVKAPIIAISTYLGIYFNLKYTKIYLENRKKKQNEKQKI